MLRNEVFLPHISVKMSFCMKYFFESRITQCQQFKELIFSTQAKLFFLNYRTCKHEETLSFSDWYFRRNVEFDEVWSFSSPARKSRALKDLTWPSRLRVITRLIQDLSPHRQNASQSPPRLEAQGAGETQQLAGRDKNEQMVRLFICWHCRSILSLCVGRYALPRPKVWEICSGRLREGGQRDPGEKRTLHKTYDYENVFGTCEERRNQKDLGRASDTRRIAERFDRSCDRIEWPFI